MNDEIEYENLTVRELAVRIRVNPGTIYNWISNGRLDEGHGLLHAGSKDLIHWPTFRAAFLGGREEVSTRPPNQEYPVKEGEMQREPTRPGEVLAEDVLPPLKLSVADAAKRLGVTRQTLYRVIRGEAAVTPDMAVRLGKLCGNGPRLWLSMQQAYDLWHAQRRLAATIEQIPTMRV